MTQDKGVSGKVVLLHGFAGWPIYMRPLAGRLKRSGYATLSPFYPSWRSALPDIVERLIEPVLAFDRRQPGPIHFVGHSMGGLVIRALIARQRPANLGAVVMLGTPNAGSEVADMLYKAGLSRLVTGNATPALLTLRPDHLETVLGSIDYPAGVIAGDKPLLNKPLSWPLPSPHDGKVSVYATHVQGETDHITLPLTHAALPYAPLVHEQVIAFLSHKKFIRNS